MNKFADKLTQAFRYLAVCAILTITLACGSATAVDYVLMLQHTPSNGGTVSPEPGVHNISANGAVTVVARPKPGYQFVYWLGDVADSTSNSTVVSVNAPKIVVAVFQPSEYAEPFKEPSPSNSVGGGGGGLIPNRQYVGGGGGVSPASGVQYGNQGSYIVNQFSSDNQPPSSDDSRNDPPPVPNGDVPEPATMLLLGVGSILALCKKR